MSKDTNDVIVECFEALKAHPDLTFKVSPDDTMRVFMTQQRAFQHSVDARCESDDKAERAQFIMDHVNYMNNEVAEMLQELPYFKKWKDYSKMTNEEMQEAYAKVKKEFVDIWHFVINIAIAIDLSPEELVTMYLKKNKENILRQTEGYDHTKRHLDEDERRDFEAYEKVRQSGIYNMITDASKAAVIAGLSLDRYYWLIDNYSELKQKYGGEQQ